MDVSSYFHFASHLPGGTSGNLCEGIKRSRAAFLGCSLVDEAQSATTGQVPFANGLNFSMHESR